MENERRLLLAVVLMIAVIVVTNLLFPPVTPPSGAEAPDTATVVEEGPAGAEAVGPDTAARVDAAAAAVDTAGRRPEPGEQEEESAEEVARAMLGEERRPAAPAGGADGGDTIVVRSPLYEYRFSTRGAALVDAVLPRYESYAPGEPEGAPVRLIRPGDRLLGFQVAVGPDTLDLRSRTFEASATELRVESAPDSLVFRHRVGDSGLAFVATYRFRPDGYLMDVGGRLEGLGARGYTVLTSLGRGLPTNEANPEEDLDQLAYVVHDRDGDFTTEKLSDVEADETGAVSGGPFGWVAVKNKYFLIALIAGEGSTGFGGLLVRGVAGEGDVGPAAAMTATLPVPAGVEGFGFGAFLGPQDYGRLTHIGQDLENVNPYGWRWLRPIIRPLVGLIMAVLVWMHETFALAYGWVLIVFGVLMRVVLFPLYQKSMRAQMAQMQVQPLIKELQSKYKDDPQKLQKQMMRIYKEHNINPLAGCLPMLLPFPVLITLFFVFQNTIEFRGVPFLWLPDLSLKDPLYIIPLLMGLSMFLLQWIGQRGMESNTQMKIMGYGMPILFTFLFLNFPSGLNLYYATSNFASLPQQLYLSKERRKARVAAPAET